MRYVKVAMADEIPEGGVRAVAAEGRAIALFRVEGRIYAIEDRCAHQFAPLSEGTVCGKVVTCALHGWQFDVTTGEAPIGGFPKVSAFPVKVEGGAVLVGIQ